MRFMVMVKATKDSEAGVLPDEKILTAMGKFNEELAKAGVLLAGEGLHPSSKGARVRFDGDTRQVIDGPFAETKELIAGFWLWQVKSMEEAVEWLKRAPFDGGTEVELRPVFEAEDFGDAPMYVTVTPTQIAVLPSLGERDIFRSLQLMPGVAASTSWMTAFTRALSTPYSRAQALMIVMSIHLLRIVLTGSYARHRRLNYLIGIGMFLLVLFLDFTGYVLRWDVDICYPLTTGTNLLKTIPLIGDYLMLADMEAGLFVVDVTTPDQPNLLCGLMTCATATWPAMG